VLGPIDINELRSGRYLRREKGKLPDRAPRVPRRDLQGELGDL
jgi:hypothetical protein